MNNKTKLKYITEVEIYDLALHQLKIKANRIARNSSKSARDRLDVVNLQRKNIAQELYHKFGISKDELYLKA